METEQKESQDAAPRKKKRAADVVILLIIIAQIGWLLGVSIYNEIRISKVPHIIVNVGKTLADTDIDPLRCTYSVKIEDKAVFGRSLWWGESWTERSRRGEDESGESGETEAEERSIPCDPRPKPEDVTGAAELDREFFDAPHSCSVSVIWKQGKNGEWNFRLEAPGSSEDVLREGELRTAGYINYTPVCDEKDEDKVIPACTVFPFGDAVFRLSDSSLTAIRNYRARKEEKQTALVNYTVEVAPVEGGEPACVSIRIGGLPLREAISRMNNDSFPLPDVPQNK